MAEEEGGGGGGGADCCCCMCRATASLTICCKALRSIVKTGGET